MLTSPSCFPNEFDGLYSAEKLCCGHGQEHGQYIRNIRSTVCTTCHPFFAVQCERCKDWYTPSMITKHGAEKLCVECHLSSLPEEAKDPVANWNIVLILLCIAVAFYLPYLLTAHAGH